MYKSNQINQDFQHLMNLTGFQLAERLGYQLKDLQIQVRRWSLGSLESNKIVEPETLKEITKKVASISRSDSKDRAQKANQLHYMAFGEPATDVPTEAKTDATDTEPPAEKRPKATPNPAPALKEFKRTLERTDFSFIESFIEWLASAAPIAIIVFAAASFIATGIFNAVFYGHYIGLSMGVFLAVVQDGARFALFLASAKMFKTGKSLLGGISALVSFSIVIFEIYEAGKVAEVWNKTEATQVALTFGFIVILGFALELVMALIIHPFKK